MTRTAIIGVGNKLMGDEGVGVHAVEYLRSLACHPESAEGGRRIQFTKLHDRDSSVVPLPQNDNNVDLLDAGTGGMALFHLLAKYERVIIIDAADFGGRPGEVRTFIINPPSPPFNKGGEETEHPPLKKGGRGGFTLTPDSDQVSLHGTSLAGILQLAEKLGTKMPHITIVAVQPEYIGCKLELSPTVKKALDEIVTVVAPFMGPKVQAR